MLRILIYCGCLVIGLKAAKAETQRPETSEFCEWESVNITCPPDAVLLIHEARYGRMNLGRCVEKAYGELGCATDVSAELDARCGGRRHCDVSVISLHGRRSCPADLKSFLQLQYTCTTVNSFSGGCPRQGYMKVTGPNGQLSNEFLTPKREIPSSPLTGTIACPWRISVDPHQTINISMLDFSVSPHDALWHSLTAARGRGGRAECGAVLGWLMEPGHQGSNVSLCSGVRRDAVVYQSMGNTVDIVFNPELSASPVIIKYQALGCAPLTAPPQAHVRLTEGGVAVVECNATREAWYLTCRGTQWVGSFSNCSRTRASYESSGEVGYPMHQTFPFGVLLVVILGVTIGVVLGLTLLLVTLSYLRRRKQRRVRSRSQYMLHPLDDAAKYGVISAQAQHAAMFDPYMDRHSLIVGQGGEPFYCQTISGRCHNRPECTVRLQRSHTSHSAGDILEGIMPSVLHNGVQAPPSASVEDCTATSLRTPYRHRDKSLDYKWESTSVHENISKVATDAAHAKKPGTCAQAEKSKPSTFFVDMRKPQEPYYFSYDRKNQGGSRPESAEVKCNGNQDVVGVCSKQESVTEEKRPDVVTTCGSCNNPSSTPAFV